MLATGEGTDPDRLGTGPTAGGKQTLTEQRLAFLFFLSMPALMVATWKCPPKEKKNTKIDFKQKKRSGFNEVENDRRHRTQSKVSIFHSVISISSIIHLL